MICPKCGKEIDDNSTFCVFCGKKIQDEVVQDGVPTNVQNNVQAAGRTGEYSGNISGGTVTLQQKNNKKTLILIIAVAAAVVAFLLAWFLFASPKTRAAKQLDIGEQYLKEKKYEDAIVAFNASIKIDKKNIKPYEGLVIAHKALNQYDEAAEAMELAITNIGLENIPEHDITGLVDSYTVIANTAESSGDTDKAQQCYDRILELQPDNKTATEKIADLKVAKNADDTTTEGSAEDNTIDSGAASTENIADSGAASTDNAPDGTAMDDGVYSGSLSESQITDIESDDDYLIFTGNLDYSKDQQNHNSSSTPTGEGTYYIKYDSNTKIGFDEDVVDGDGDYTEFHEMTIDDIKKYLGTGFYLEIIITNGKAVSVIGSA